MYILFNLYIIKIVIENFVKFQVMNYIFEELILK